MMTTLTIASQVERLLRQIAVQLQLSDSAHSSVSSQYEALAQYLANGSLAPLSPTLYPQGSYRIGTTVKPIDREEYDLDFVVELNAPNSVAPGALFERVASEIEANGQYADKTERKTRCIRIRLAGQFHIDVVPAIPDPTVAGSAILIPERKGNQLVWRSTNPKGYVVWFESMSRGPVTEKRAAIELLPPPTSVDEKTVLQVGVQLLKRHHQLHVRDEKLRTPSIVLTTIAGLEAGGLMSLGDCMSAIVEGVLRYAQNPAHIHNPAAPDEVITEKWTDGAVFAEFCAQAEKLAIQWNALIASEGQGYQALEGLLSQMFGEAPVQGALRALGGGIRTVSDSGRLGTTAGGLLVTTARGHGNPRKTFFGNE